MHNKDLYLVAERCKKTIVDNMGCAFCRGMKRCEDYPQDVDKAMAHINKRWQDEWDRANNIEPVKKKKHNPPNSKVKYEEAIAVSD